jgi:hypothetical protein
MPLENELFLEPDRLGCRLKDADIFKVGDARLAAQFSGKFRVSRLGFRVVAEGWCSCWVAGLLGGWIARWLDCC